MVLLLTVLLLLSMLLPPAPNNAPTPNNVPTNIVVKMEQMESQEVEIVLNKSSYNA